MGTEITLTLSDDLMRRAESVARLVGRPVAEVLADAITASLRPLGPDLEGEATRSPADWTDEEVLAAVDATLSDREQERLSELLARQKSAALTASEQVELTTLMEIYQRGLLRKSGAMREAARPGLRERLRS
jgi:predicted transcriptional regulator